MQSENDMLRVLTGVLMILCSATAWAHPTTLMVCGDNIVTAREISASVRSNGLYSERYDTNADGVVDLETLSTVILTNPDGTVEHAHHPTFYIRDLDYNHTPDVVLIDKTGEGICDEIAIYEDLREPRSSRDRTTIPNGRSF